MPDRKELGRAAEDQAADFLLGQGYTIVTRRFKGQNGEADVVCLHGEVLVFVEVKLKTAKDYVPEEAIGEAKLNALQRVAQEYVRKFEVKRDFRFDVIAIDRSGLRHHIDILGNR